MEGPEGIKYECNLKESFGMAGEMSCPREQVRKIFASNTNNETPAATPFSHPPKKNNTRKKIKIMPM